MRLVSDTEGDGLYDTVTRLWCIVNKDIDTGAVYQYGPDEIHKGIQQLQEADLVIGHNFIGYDIPSIKKCYNEEINSELFDTLVVSRLLNPDRPNPKGWVGKPKPHSIEAWGMRFGQLKPTHEDWSRFSPEMLHRCTEDVHIGHKVYERLLWEISR